MQLSFLTDISILSTLPISIRTLSAPEEGMRGQNESTYSLPMGIQLDQAFLALPAWTNLVTSKRADPMKQLTPAKTFVYLKEPLSSETILPPMGDPVKAAKDAMAIDKPVRVPISCSGAMEAQRVGTKLIPAPETKP
jgi:hypothetical protein